MKTCKSCKYCIGEKFYTPDPFDSEMKYTCSLSNEQIVILSWNDKFPTIPNFCKLKKKEDMNTNKVYAIITNENLTDGYGREYCLGFSKNKFCAIANGKNKYVQGTQCPIKEIEVKYIDNVAYIPLNLLREFEPTVEDLENEKFENEKNEMIQKMKELGYNPEKFLK